CSMAAACSAIWSRTANGSVTAATSSSSPIPAASSATCASCSSVSAPSGLCTTTVPVAPAESGSDWWSSSMTSIDSMYETSNEDVRVPCHAKYAPAAITRTTSHVASTTHARLAAKIPARYSQVAMSAVLLSVVIDGCAHAGAPGTSCGAD